MTGSPFSSGGNKGGFPPMPPIGSPSTGAPKQNKNQIITNLYKTILGRDPDPNALMYYISQPEVNEDAVRKQMVESEEHKSILEEFKNIQQLKKEIEDLKSTTAIKDKAIEDKQVEIEQLNKILAHKSQEIAKVREEIEKMQKEFNTTPMRVVDQQPPVIDSGISKAIRSFLKKFSNID